MLSIALVALGAADVKFEIKKKEMKTITQHMCAYERVENDEIEGSFIYYYWLNSECVPYCLLNASTHMHINNLERIRIAINLY